VKHRLLLTLTFFVATFVLSASARADSDGFFCTSKGYVAYELRQGITQGIVGHKLKVVRVEPDRGIYVAGEATLLDFETYHMTCSQERIEISGWRKVFTKYVIDILPSGEMKVSGPLEYPDVDWRDAAKDGPESPSLCLFGPKEVPLLVESLDSEHEYQLLRNLSGRQSAEGFEWHVKSELVQVDKRENALHRLVLYERRYIEARD
jgi:hypothetical protein